MFKDLMILFAANFVFQMGYLALTGVSIGLLGAGVAGLVIGLGYSLAKASLATSHEG